MKRRTIQTPLNATILVLSLLAASSFGREALLPPAQVEVMPLFFVPADQPKPTLKQHVMLMRHVQWTQRRYEELLGKGNTFAIKKGRPIVYESKNALKYFRAQDNFSYPEVADELLTQFEFTRYNCPYVFLVIMLNPKDLFPISNAAPLNGGFNRGGGLVLISSYTLDNMPNFQSTLEHELGHAFGLPHVSEYGFSMTANRSMMSYNKDHHTRGFEPGKSRGEFIPEDIRGLAWNDRVFPNLEFAPTRHIPPLYSLSTLTGVRRPPSLPGRLSGPSVVTRSGASFNSSIKNVVEGEISPNELDGRISFNEKTMWHSTRSIDGWVYLRVTLPLICQLDAIAVHSQHSGAYHIAEAVRIWRADENGEFQLLGESNLKSADEVVAFEQTPGRTWRFDFKAGESGSVVLRGLRFFSSKHELFAPLIPHPKPKSTSRLVRPKAGIRP